MQESRSPASLFRHIQHYALAFVTALCLPAIAWADAVDDTHQLLKTQLTKAQGIMFLLGVAATMGLAYAWWFSNGDNQQASKKTRNFAIGCVFLFGGVGMIQVFKKAYANQAF